jgi:hypothetical protein
MATNPKDYQAEYMKKRRSTQKGKEEAVEISMKWQKENSEAYKTYRLEYEKKYREENRESYNIAQRDLMRKRRAQAKALKENENQSKD